MDVKNLGILFFPPGEPPEDLVIDGGLRAMQQLVGGLIETMYIPELGPDVVLIGNDEARLIGLDWNRTTDRFPIAGPFFASGCTRDGGSRSLTRDEHARILRYFEGREIQGKSFPPQGPAITLDAHEAARTVYQDAAALAIQQHLSLQEFDQLYTLAGFEHGAGKRLVEMVVDFIHQHHAMPGPSEFTLLFTQATTGSA